MTLVYIRTCDGGNHHVFQDDVTSEIVVYVTEELDALGLQAQKSANFIKSLDATALAGRIPGIGTKP